MANRRGAMQYTVSKTSDLPFMQDNQVGALAYVKATGELRVFDGKAWTVVTSGTGGGSVRVVSERSCSSILMYWLYGTRMRLLECAAGEISSPA